MNHSRTYTNQTARTKIATLDCKSPPEKAFRANEADIDQNDPQAVEAVKKEK